MIQRFIELGEGYSDLYELLELAKAQPERVLRLFALHTVKDSKNVTSLAVAMKQTDPGKFQAIYICREGIPNPELSPNKRYDLFKDMSESIGIPITAFDVKPSDFFAEKDLYYQYLVGILRMNRFIPPLQ